MSYEIKTTDGLLIVIQDGSVNSSPALSIGLVGRNTLNYGGPWAETFVHMLEHFASDNVKPINPIPGQLWYNKTDKSVYVNTGDDIHNYDSWEKIAIENRLGDINNPIDSIFVGTITGDNFVGGDFTGDSFTGDNFNGGTFTGTFEGNLHGIADQAYKWVSSRRITLTGDVTGETLIDGTSNVAITATVVDDSHNHIISNVDGLQSALDGLATSGHTHPGTIPTSISLAAGVHLDTLKTANVYYQSSNANATLATGYPEASAGSLIVTQASGPVQQYFVYNSSRVYTRGQTGAGAWTAWAKQYNTLNKPTPADIGALPVGGNAVTASALQSARRIALSGDATGSVYFDGTADVTITTAVTDNSHAHTIANITDLQNQLNSKSPTSHSHTPAEIGAAPANHTHSAGQIGGLFDTLDGAKLGNNVVYTNTTGAPMLLNACITSISWDTNSNVPLHVYVNGAHYGTITFKRDDDGEYNDEQQVSISAMVPVGATYKISAHDALVWMTFRCY